MQGEEPQGGAPPPDATFAQLESRRRGPVRRFLHAHPVAADFMLSAAYLLVMSVSVVPSLEAGYRIPAATTAATAVLLLWRRRRALVVLAATVVLSTVAGAVDPAFAFTDWGVWLTLYAAAAQYASRRMFTIAVLVSAVQILLLFFRVLPASLSGEAGARDGLAAMGNPGEAVWLLAALLAVGNLAAVGIGASVRNNRLHDAELANWGCRVSTLAQVAERNRIAREMHDVVAHSLSVMIALSDGAAVVIKRDPERASQVLRELSATGRGALADMRRVIGVLRDGSNAPLAPQPASSSLREMLDGFRVAGVPLEFAHEGPPLPDDAAFQLTVYRIVQESLTNVLRYGRGVTRVEVSIARDGDTVRLRVADDGQLAGQPREAVGSGQGLKGIAERAAIYGGSAYAGPGPAVGWVVHAILTVPREGEVPPTPESDTDERDRARRP